MVLRQTECYPDYNEEFVMASHFIGLTDLKDPSREHRSQPRETTRSPEPN